MILAVLTFVSRADIVDGGFASGTLISAGTYIAASDTNIDQGWYEYDNGTQWDVVGGVLTRNFANLGNGGRSVAQIFSADFAAGNYIFDFEYNWTSTDTSGDIWVQLYLYDNLSGSSSLSYQDRMDLTGATQFTTPTGSANFSITELATSSNLIGSGTSGSFSSILIGFNLASDMGSGDLLAVRIGALNAGGDASAILQFDNVFDIIPEPATFSMFGMGGLGAWIIGRSLRKSKA